MRENRECATEKRREYEVKAHVLDTKQSYPGW